MTKFIKKTWNIGCGLSAVVIVLSLAGTLFAMTMRWLSAGGFEAVAKAGILIIGVSLILAMAVTIEEEMK